MRLNKFLSSTALTFLTVFALDNACATETDANVNDERPIVKTSSSTSDPLQTLNLNELAQRLAKRERSKGIDELQERAMLEEKILHGQALITKIQTTRALRCCLLGSKIPANSLDTLSLEELEKLAKEEEIYKNNMLKILDEEEANSEEVMKKQYPSDVYKLIYENK